VETLYLEDSYHLVTLDRERNKVAKATLAFFEAQLAGDLAASQSSSDQRIA
jgi:alpha-beta hydrolase superfamily lysophospholipase